MEKDLSNWFLKMGYPPNLIPHDSHIKKICRGQMGSIWQDVMNKTVSQAEVRRIKLKLLLGKIKKQEKCYELNESANITISNEMEMWNKKKRLETEISNLNENIIEINEGLERSQKKLQRKRLTCQDFEKKIIEISRCISILQQKEKYLSNLLNEYNDKYECAKKLNLLKNNSNDINNEIINKIKQIVATENSSTDKLEHDKVINDYKKNFSSYNTLLWNSIFQSKLDTKQNCIDTTQTKVQYSTALQEDYAKLCLVYNNLELKYLDLTTVNKKVESKFQSIMGNLSDTNREYIEKYLNKAGLSAAIHYLKSELEHLNQLFYCTDVSVNSTIEAINNVQDAIETENESIETKLYHLDCYYEKLSTVQQIFQNTIKNIKLNIAPDVKKYLDSNINFIPEITYFVQHPLMLSSVNLNDRHTYLNCLAEPIEMLGKFIDSPEHCPIYTILYFFKKKITWEVMKNVEIKDFAFLEELPLYKFIISLQNRSSYEEKKDDLLIQFEEIANQISSQTAFCSKLDEILHFWADQPMKHVLSKSRLFDGYPFNYYAEKYDKFYDRIKTKET